MCSSPSARTDATISPSATWSKSSSARGASATEGRSVSAFAVCHPSATSRTSESPSRAWALRRHSAFQPSPFATPNPTVTVRSGSPMARTTAVTATSSASGRVTSSSSLVSASEQRDHGEAAGQVQHAHGRGVRLPGEEPGVEGGAGGGPPAAGVRRPARGPEAPEVREPGEAGGGHGGSAEDEALGGPRPERRRAGRPAPGDEVDQDQPEREGEERGQHERERPQARAGERVQQLVPPAVRPRQHELGGVDEPERDQEQREALAPGARREAAPVVALEDVALAGGAGGPEEAGVLVARHLLDPGDAEQRLRRRSAHPVDAQLDPGHRGRHTGSGARPPGAGARTAISSRSRRGSGARRRSARRPAPA